MLAVKKKAKNRFQLLKGFYNIVANVRLAHSCSDRCFGSEVLEYEMWNEWLERIRESVLVCKKILFKKRGVLIDMTRQKLSFIFHRSSVKKWCFLLEISAVSFNITTWKYVCTKNVLNMNVLVKKGVEWWLIHFDCGRNYFNFVSNLNHTVQIQKKWRQECQKIRKDVKKNQ